MLHGLDLFSGIGGLAVALAPWVRPVAYCEIDEYCRGVLLSRMAAGDVPVAPIWDDVTSLRWSLLPDGPIDIVYGGFPCQDISVAGNGAGLAGERSGLVSEIFRLTDELRPSFVFLENVPAIRLRGADVVVRTMAALGYDCRWDVLSAYDVGAPHKRDRWFLLAANADNPKHGSVEDVSERPRPQSKGTWWWHAEPNVGRVADGVRGRVDRLRALGNAVVPSQAREAFVRLMGLR